MITGEAAVGPTSSPEMFLEAPGKPTLLPAAWRPAVALSRSSHVRAVIREARQAFLPASEGIPTLLACERAAVFSRKPVKARLRLELCFYGSSVMALKDVFKHSCANPCETSFALFVAPLLKDTNTCTRKLKPIAART